MSLLLDLDHSVSDALRVLSETGWMRAVLEFFSEPASALVALPFVVAYVVRGGAPARRRILQAIVVVACSDFFSGVVLKNAFPRVRPNGTSSSFPSSHAANAMGQAVFFSLCHPRLAPLLVPIAAMVCLSRVSLGKHWPTDVAAGALVGTLVAIAVWSLARAWEKRRRFTL